MCSHVRIYRSRLVLIKINIHRPPSIFLYQKITVYICGSAHFRSVISQRTTRASWTLTKKKKKNQFSYSSNPFFFLSHLSLTAFLRVHVSDGWYVCKTSSAAIGKVESPQTTKRFVTKGVCILQPEINEFRCGTSIQTPPQNVPMISRRLSS